MSRGKRARAPLKPGTVIASIMVCTALCFAGIGYVWAKTQVWSLGREMKKLENRLEELKRRNEVLQQSYAAMCTPARLDESVRRLHLGLATPRPDQIIKLLDPAPAAPSAQKGAVYARAE